MSPDEPSRRLAAGGDHDVRVLLDGISSALGNDPGVLAAALGVCRSDLWRWEAGDLPSPEQRARIERLARQADRLVTDGAVRALPIAPRRGPAIRT